jgi:hypothetical protein
MRASSAIAAALLLCAAAARGEDPSPRVVLRWQSVPGAAGYDLQVSRDATFAVREVDVRVELAGYRLGSPPTAGRRYWRVRTVDGDGRPGPWSTAKVIEPLEAGPGTPAPPEPVAVLLDVPPVAPAPLPAEPAEPQPPSGAEPGPPLASRAGDVPPPPTAPPESELEGMGFLGLLRAGRPALMAGWRSNLLGVSAPLLAAEGRWPFPWLGARWGVALRAGWWREATKVPASLGLYAPLPATADVVPLALLLTRELPTRWARLYAGAGAGLHLVVMRQEGMGSLGASGALEAVVGAGRRVGPGEPFVELAAGLGGVDGPLGRLRTGGISLSVGYRLR